LQQFIERIKDIVKFVKDVKKCTIANADIQESVGSATNTL
jgi:hypothetical protein